MPDRPRLPVLVYDGDCGFCTRSARWISHRWADPAAIVAWQELGADGLRELGLSEAQVTDAAWWVGADGHPRRGHRAIAAAMAHATGWARIAGRLLAAPPLSWLGTVVYPLIARYRHRMPGGSPSCRVQ
ncbi:MAG: DUF393 domain-containing protein [Actinobacteria bacterium]|nr:DUF393 domain-containing protein [Actinomycetota bacterium]